MRAEAERLAEQAAKEAKEAEEALQKQKEAMLAAKAQQEAAAEAQREELRKIREEMDSQKKASEEALKKEKEDLNLAHHEKEIEALKEKDDLARKQHELNLHSQEIARGKQAMLLIQAQALSMLEKADSGGQTRNFGLEDDDGGDFSPSKDGEATPGSPDKEDMWSMDWTQHKHVAENADA
jgi:hypothetical protein